MKVMMVGISDVNMRVTIPVYLFKSWMKENRLSDCHRSVYYYDSVCTSITVNADQIFHEIDENALESIGIVNKYYKGYERIFISSGRNLHVLVSIDRLPIEQASSSLYAHLKKFEFETDIRLDKATIGNVMQMRRCPGSLNPKSQTVACYIHPETFDISSEPIILDKGNKYPIKITEKVEEWNKSNPIFGDNVDPYSLNIEFPSGYGHHDRIELLRKLRNMGVTKEKTLDFVKNWLPPKKYQHMIGEGVADRIFEFKL